MERSARTTKCMRSAYGLHWIQCNSGETNAHWRPARCQRHVCDMHNVEIWSGFKYMGDSGKFSTKNGSSERLVLQCLKYPSSQQLELLQGDMYIYICTHIYVENQVSAGWLSQLNLSNWKCENMCHHRATDQLGPPHGQAGKAFTPKFHTPSWLLAPLSWGAGKTASNRRGHVTFLNSVSKRRTDLEEHDNLHHTKKKPPSGRF